MIADDAELEKLFHERLGVVFVDCGENLGIRDRHTLNKGKRAFDYSLINLKYTINNNK